MAARRGPRSLARMKLTRTPLAVVLCLGMAAHAEDSSPPGPKADPPKAASTAATVAPSTVRVSSGGGGTGFFLVDLFANLALFGVHAAVVHDRVERAQAPLEDSWGMRLERRDDPQLWDRRTRRHDARQGLLFSFGVGGGSLRVSPQRGTGAVDLNFRLGYGFSDRFQFFGDLTVDGGNHADGTEIASWTFTARGQTVLIGDRDGNGLNVNAGVGLGGITRRYGTYPDYDSPAGLAFAGGLSYDARMGRNFSFSPELFFTWHQVPNGVDVAGRPLPKDVATTAGLRLNFLWYLY